MKKPYIKKYSQIGDVCVWIVNGNHVRTNMDEEFTNFGHHYRFKFIPKNEFWCDEEYGEGNEKDFYIEDMLTMRKLILKGFNYEEACQTASNKERDERRKSSLYKEYLWKGKHDKKVLEKVYVNIIKKYSGKLKVWIVRGEVVRDVFFLDFTEGGHDKVYSFIPKNEVWIDDDISELERKFIILHEIHERRLMAKGMNYDSAHQSSSKLEYHYRHCKDQIDKAIKEELKENEKLCI